MATGVAFVALSLLSGGLVGFILGLIGSGGSILALPLLVYVVGYEGDPHVAIGTTALAVGANALANALNHSRHGAVRLGTGATFAVPGVLGATAGAQLGLLTDGARLLFLFALLMLAVAYNMARGSDRGGPGAEPDAPPPEGARGRTAAAGLGVGGLAGYFGIGGGFLIVPALMRAARFDVRAAIGTSLVAVAAFGLTTAARYGLAGKLDPAVAGLFILGGVLGGAAGTALSHRAPRDRLRRLFAGVLVLVAIYMLYQNYGAFA